ncbi:MAG: ethanolamine ammonia-lyase small subunit [Planctomycetota bacterium]|jgi:ethanolamine ammonia-lyase small subunit
MSTTRELVERLRRQLGVDDPLSPAEPGLFLTPPPQRIFPGAREQSSYKREASAHTSALVGIGNVGTRYATDVVLQFQAELAVARGAVASPLPDTWCEENRLLPLKSRVNEHQEFLLRPDLGRRLDDESRLLLQAHAQNGVDVQPILADGLSALACVGSGMKVLSALTQECQQLGLSVGTPMCARYARVWLEDEIGELLRARVAIIILGERPGLGTGDGLSAYAVYDPAVGKTDSDRNMISNIHVRGTSPIDAATRLARMARAMIQQSRSGVELDLSQLDDSSTDLAPRTGQVRARLVEVTS